MCKWIRFGVLFALVIALPVAKASERVQLLGDVSHFEWNDQLRIEKAALDLAQQSNLRVCVAVSDKTKGLYNLVMTCDKGVVMALDLEGKDVQLTVDPASELGQKLTTDISNKLISQDIVRLLRRGKGAEGVVNGLEGLVLILQGKYEPPQPGWLSWTWPLVLVVTILALWGIGRQSEGRGKGAGILMDGQGLESDLQMPDSPTTSTVNKPAKVMHGRW